MLFLYCLKFLVKLLWEVLLFGFLYVFELISNPSMFQRTKDPMRVATLFALALVFGAALAAFPVGDLSLHTVPTASHGNRYYIAYFPNSAANAQNPLPVLFVYHEQGGSCFNLLTSASRGWKAAAEARAVVIIAPCALEGEWGFGWNSGVSQGFAENDPDDVAFSLQVLQSVANNVNIDWAHVGTSGFGNGGYMSQAIACKAASNFTFSGVVSGLVEIRPGNLEGLTKCDSDIALQSSRPKILLVQGDQDGITAWSGNRYFGYPTPIENYMQWAARNGCNVSSGPTENWNSGLFESRSYVAGCTGSNSNSTVEMVRWWGGGYAWPSAASGFDATTYIVSSFLMS